MSARCGCGDVMVGMLLGYGVEATVSDQPPLVDTGLEALDIVCEHGVMWYGEPTSDQIAAWVADGQIDDRFDRSAGDAVTPPADPNSDGMET